MLEKLIIFIPIENIGFERFVQTFSLYTFIVAIISPFLLLFLKIKKFSIFSSILWLTIWLIFSSAVKTLIEFEVPENFFRAFSGLVIGLLMFISLREIVLRYDSLNWFKYLYYSYIILFVFFIYDLIFNFQETSRIYASYIEPSHLGINNEFSIVLLLKFIFGVGLGNDLSFLQFLPPVVADQIMSVKAFGRIFSYSGIIGFILYFIFIFSIYKKIKLIFSTSKQKTILISWLITYFFACSFDMAPFQTIALWFLPAYIDGISLKLKKPLINNYTTYKQEIL